jgi:CheY-like chemotaxis protein
LWNRFGPRGFKQAVEACFSDAQKPRALPNSLPIPPEPDTHFTATNPKDTSIPDIQKPETSPAPSTQEPLLPSGPRRLSLLLVEDNPINLKLLVASFKKMGHNYLTATDGSLAVAAYRNANEVQSPRFDIIFMDIQMPVMDGMEASLEIRKYEKQNGLQPAIIIVLTALTTLQAEQEALDAGADRFMNKPVSIKTLRDVVEEYFRVG